MQIDLDAARRILHRLGFRCVKRSEEIVCYRPGHSDTKIILTRLSTPFVYKPVEYIAKVVKQGTVHLDPIPESWQTDPAADDFVAYTEPYTEYVRVSDVLKRLEEALDVNNVRFDTEVVSGLKEESGRVLAGFEIVLEKTEDVLKTAALYDALIDKDIVAEIQPDIATWQFVKNGTKVPLKRFLEEVRRRYQELRTKFAL